MSSDKKRIILTHRFYETRRWAKLYLHFFNELEKRFGFRVQYTDRVHIPSDTEVVLAYAVPHFKWHNLLVKELVNLDPSVYLIVWTGDLHCRDFVPNVDTKECIRNTKRVFERADLILSGFDTRMRDVYFDYVDKYRYFPWSFIPQDAYEELHFNETPIMQCLMVGHVIEGYSSLRARVRRYAKKTTMVRYVKRVEVNQYPLLLNKYFAGITDVGSDDIIHAKHFEIPATGSLLLCRQTDLLDKIGFIPYQHYVPVTKINWFLVVDVVLARPDDYREVRLRGMDFVRKYHGFDNRMSWLDNLMRSIL